MIITATDANRDFSKLLGRVAKGEEATITVRGKAIAKLIPFAADNEAQELRKGEHLARLRKQPMINKSRGTRDELYDD